MRFGTHGRGGSLLRSVICRSILRRLTMILTESERLIGVLDLAFLRLGATFARASLCRKVVVL